MATSASSLLLGRCLATHFVHVVLSENLDGEARREFYGDEWLEQSSVVLGAELKLCALEWVCLG